MVNTNNIINNISYVLILFNYYILNIFNDELNINLINSANYFTLCNSPLFFISLIHFINSFEN